LEFSYKGIPDEEQLTNFARATRFRKNKKRAIAEGRKFDTMSALCQCGSKNCDGNMWEWEHERDDGDISSAETKGSEEESQMQNIGILDDPNDGEYSSEDEVDELESEDEVPRRVEMM
jgi:hypothetical protein